GRRRRRRHRQADRRARRRLRRPLDRTRHARGDPAAMNYARVWRGRPRPQEAHEYERYWRGKCGQPPLQRGARGGRMLREDHESYCEFVTISYWDSIEAMGAGADPNRTHHLPHDHEFLIDMSERVQILTVLETHGEM